MGFFRGLGLRLVWGVCLCGLLGWVVDLVSGYLVCAGVVDVVVGCAVGLFWGCFCLLVGWWRCCRFGG